VQASNSKRQAQAAAQRMIKQSLAVQGSNSRHQRQRKVASTY